MPGRAEKKWRSNPSMCMKFRVRDSNAACVMTLERCIEDYSRHWECEHPRMRELPCREDPGDMREVVMDRLDWEGRPVKLRE